MDDGRCKDLAGSRGPYDLSGIHSGITPTMIRIQKVPASLAGRIVHGSSSMADVLDEQENTPLKEQPTLQLNRHWPPQPCLRAPKEHHRHPVRQLNNPPLLQPCKQGPHK
jgi:hypothetical protein